MIVEVYLVVVRLVEPPHQWVHPVNELQQQLTAGPGSETHKGARFVVVDQHLVAANDRRREADQGDTIPDSSKRNWFDNTRAPRVLKGNDLYCSSFTV